MKRFLLIATLLASALVSGCRSVLLADTEQMNMHTSPADRVVASDSTGDVVVQKVEFRSGVSSATVERLARNAGCNSKTGAGLLTEEGPLEVYRVTCDNGTVFMAQCEFRQCKRMP